MMHKGKSAPMDMKSKGKTSQRDEISAMVKKTMEDKPMKKMSAKEHKAMS